MKSPLYLPLLVALLVALSSKIPAQQTSFSTTEVFFQAVDSLNYYSRQYASVTLPLKNGDEYEKKEDTFIALRKYLTMVLANPEMKKYMLHDLINDEGIIINASADNKVFFLIVDEKTGGTYRPYYSLMYYHINDTIQGYSEMGEPYFQVMGIPDSSVPKYLIASQLYGCMTCITEAVSVLDFENGEPSFDDIYHFNGRKISDFDYNANTKTFTYWYDSPFPEDLLYGDEAMHGEYRYHTEGTMQFQDGKFVKISECETLITD